MSETGLHTAVADIAGGTRAEDVWEQGVEENVWA